MSEQSLAVGLREVQEALAGMLRPVIVADSVNGVTTRRDDVDDRVAEVLQKSVDALHLLPRLAARAEQLEANNRDLRAGIEQAVRNIAESDRVVAEVIENNRLAGKSVV